MKTKHTKGEWKIDETKCGINIPSVLGMDVAVWHYEEEEEEAEANAKIIAAAPELLNACIDTLRLLELKPTKTNLYQRNKIKYIIKKATD